MAHKVNKIILNKCFGGFNISYSAYKWLIEHGMPNAYLDRKLNDEIIESRKFIKVIYDNGNWVDVRDTKDAQIHTEDELNRLCFLSTNDIPRHHPLLVQCVEELGEKASGPCSKLKVVEIDYDNYYIDDFDGKEIVSEYLEDEWCSKHGPFNINER